jgi:hypothetical protein
VQVMLQEVNAAVCAADITAPQGVERVLKAIGLSSGFGET